jgi:hypothetical protein
MALARSDKALTAPEVARTAHVSAEKTLTLLNAYQNPYHCAGLSRVGVRLEKSADGYRLRTCKAQPDAKRPERGDRKPAKKSETKAKSKPKAKRKAIAKPHEPNPVELPVEPSVGVTTEIGASDESTT